MDPEFKAILIRVIAIGGMLLAVGTGGLLFAFWKLGKATPENEPRAFVILLGVVVFILIACLVLLRSSPQVQ